jgi:5-methylthioribose kinase
LRHHAEQTLSVKGEGTGQASMNERTYKALTVDALPDRLERVEAIRERLDSPPLTWRVREVGDGNLNLVFIVEGARGGVVVVKQALPYVRLVGESWPLPLKRTFFEYHALTRQAARDPGRAPNVYHFDEAQALVAMEYLTPHKILRRDLEAAVAHPGLADQLGNFLARTLFRGSDLSMKTADRKADVALFADNVALCDITETLVFTDPYYAAAMNRHTSPQLDGVVAELRADVDLKVAAQQLKLKFCNHAETLVHGDMHTGSIMAHAGDARVIDPEFAVYGPFGFDVGMLIANFLMAYFAQSGYEARAGERDEFRGWTLDVAEGVWTRFRAEFAYLWRTERRGILFPAALYEDQGHALAAEQALSGLLQDIWVDALGFAGVEIHRRILGLAHIAEFEHIADPDIRAVCEAKALRLGRHLAVNRARILGFADIRDAAKRLETEEIR